MMLQCLVNQYLVDYTGPKLLLFFPYFLACGGPMDIIIVLDGSNSIYPWNPMNEFLQKLIPVLDIGPRNTQVTLQTSIAFL